MIRLSMNWWMGKHKLGKLEQLKPVTGRKEKLKMIGFWLLIGFAILVVLIICIPWLIYGISEMEKAHIVLSIITGVLVITGIIVGGFAWLNNTESGKRTQKSWKSETSGGIERVVTVYDVNGKLIQKYEGKFDVDYDAERIIFDDENGKRHVVYYTTGTVIIDEK